MSSLDPRIPASMSVNTCRDNVTPYTNNGYRICSPAHIATRMCVVWGTNRLGRLSQVGGGRACSWIDSIPSPPESKDPRKEATNEEKSKTKQKRYSN
jgi:hypothetical protein